MQLMEADVETLRKALTDGSLSCVDLVRFYLDRIEAYDKQGPALNAIITVNPQALEQARALDEMSRRDPGSAGPLHGIPVIIKDNYDTADMVTTAGSCVLEHARPLADAFVVQRLREAGALVLAKANLGELARNATTVSSLGGQTRNPYDLSRTPGGSSGGTGAAIAANFGVLGTGTDTGQSTRSPASAASLVGLRPTRGLISRAGILPSSTTQDEAGPITRSVADAARMLEVMAGYDPRDPITAFGASKKPAAYTSFLDANGLRGARIGLLTDVMGTQSIHEEVNAVVRQSVALMRSLGAEVVEVSIPDLEALTTDVAVGAFEFKDAFNRYLATRQPGSTVRDLDEFIADGRFMPSLAAGLISARDSGASTASPEYQRRMLHRDVLRQAMLTVMAEDRLDALLYPHQQRLVATIGEEQLERNGVLSNATGFPALTFAGGFSAPSESAPLGVPIGIELLGPDWSEPLLLKYAHAFELAAQVRRAPLSVPGF